MRCKAKNEMTYVVWLYDVLCSMQTDDDGESYRE